MVWLPFASYNLWSLFKPAVGQESWHCDMKRGFTKAWKNEPAIAALLKQDNTHQRIGHLAQKGVYEFHRDNLMLYSSNVAEKVAEILQLSRELDEVQQRVIVILKKYQEHPILLGKDITHLIRGDEGFPEPIFIRHGNYSFNLFAAIDCIYRESNGTLHILDFKTGKTDFDRRQGFVYLLAANYLYPKQAAIASFYNLETEKWSKPISATSVQINAIQIEMMRLAQQHQKDLQLYRQNSDNFDRIYPPNPGISCKYCSFSSVCKFSTFEYA